MSRMYEVSEAALLAATARLAHFIEVLVFSDDKTATAEWREVLARSLLALMRADIKPAGGERT